MDEPQRILQHRHCRRCGKAFTGSGYNERFCSKECFEYDGAEAKSKLKKYVLFIAVLWAVVIIAVVATGGFR